ncbi:MAG TPA: GNAT family N-acetyltransferase [Caulobacteraceae bacterium]|nr:GNAT family N-acetyltransferase [Caulobacteraceae bacterium]
MEVDILRPQFVPPEMVARWRELQQLDPTWDSPFLTCAWPRAVERAQDGMDRGLRVVVLHERGRPQGFMAVRRGRFTAMPAGAPMADCQALVADPSVEVDPERLVRALGVQRLDFSHMLASQTAFAPHNRGKAVSRMIDVSSGYRAYAAARKAAGHSALKGLDNIRRQAKRELGPLTFTARSASKPDLERLIELRQDELRASGQDDVFAAGWPLRLVRNLHGVEEPGFAGALFTLHFGEQLAAAHFHLLGERTVHCWLMSQEARFATYAPSLLLLQDTLRWMDKQPYTRLDLGQGDAPSKRELANVEVELMHGFVGVPSTATFVRHAAYGVRRAAEALPLGPISALPAKAMRRRDLIRGLR